MSNLGASPYRLLGRHLKQLRVRAKESLAETSGAVEIDVRQLASYELGQAKPSEDVLLLLISHFGARDDEAVNLWEMAGYGAQKSQVLQMATNDKLAPATDNKVLFTDTVDIMVNNYGVVMNFMQTGPGGSPQSVVRVGMSREHAKSILRILQKTLTQFDNGQPNRITPPGNKT
jgi:transcriptional regulator with XRE-family HTH domain